MLEFFISVVAAMAAARKQWSVVIAAGLFGTFCTALLITVTVNADLGQL